MENGLPFGYSIFIFDNSCFSNWSKIREEFFQIDFRTLNIPKKTRYFFTEKSAYIRWKTNNEDFIS